VYRSAYEGVMKSGALGEVYHTRLVWMRNGNWRRKADPPSKDFDASKWGYPTWDHLNNWRLYWRYSEGLFAELGSHQVNAANWFLGAAPERVQAMGGVYRFKDGREVPDHVFATFQYPGGITGTFASVESNAFDERYEAFFGTKGTLIIRNENDAMLFDEGVAAARPTGVEVAQKGAGAALETSETKPAQAGGTATAKAQAAAEGATTISPSTYEINAFASAIRCDTPLNCGPERASHSASWTIAANEALRTGAVVTIP
jgi:predicted dehydrogenase